MVLKTDEEMESLNFSVSNTSSILWTSNTENDIMMQII
jgi:hypothetical protein